MQLMMPAERSRLVTVIGVMGALSGCMTLLSAFTSAAPWSFTAAWVAGGLIAIAASVGLVRRMEWARRSFLGVQVFAIATALYRFAVLPSVLMRASGDPSGVTREWAGNMRGAMLPYTIVFIVINLLVIAKLTSRGVLEEFDAA